MKKMTLAVLLAAFSLSAFAQGGERGPFLTNRFRDNWFISVGGGVNVYYGEADKTVKLKNRMAPALDIAVGKWITPAIGVRLEYSGLKGRGGSPAHAVNAPFLVYPKQLPWVGEYIPKKFRYNFIHADFLWNASTTFGGYKEFRRWEVVPFIGFGPAIASSVKKNAVYPKQRVRELGFTAGLINKIRITDALDVNVEFRGMLVKQTFDGVVGGKWGEGMGTITAGLTYKFNRRGFDKPVVVAEADYSLYNDRIRLLEGDLANAQTRADQLARDLAAARNVKPAAGATDFLFPDVAIFFEIGKATLSKKEQVNVAFIAEAIKKMPADRKIVLDGNADSVTGTAKGNMTLSERRIKTVYDALIAAGVKAEQIEFVAHGDTQEPFGRENPALNRVLIIEH
jgi:outer membrane protein OmpA-like peptidoglycan-associated protein